MSKFKKVSVRLNEISSQLAVLLDCTDVKERKVTFDKFDTELKTMASDMERFVKNAKETDPDKVLYGPKMCTKILATNDEYNDTVIKMDSMRNIILSEFAPLEMKQIQEEAEAKAKEDAELRALVRERELKDLAMAKEREEKLAAVLAKEEEIKQAKEAEEAKLQAERAIYESNIKLKEELKYLSDSEDFHGVLNLFKKNSTVIEFSKGIDFLSKILTNLEVEFSDPRGRHIKKDNSIVWESIASHVCGPSCLYAIGFIEKELKSPVPGTYFVLPEPPLEDMDMYQKQLMHISDCVQIIQDYL